MPDQILMADLEVSWKQTYPHRVGRREIIVDIDGDEQTFKVSADMPNYSITAKGGSFIKVSTKVYDALDDTKVLQSVAATFTVDPNLDVFDADQDVTIKLVGTHFDTPPAPTPTPTPTP